jgi:hypothetical protein
MEKNSDMIFLQLQDVVATGRGVQKRVRSDLVLRNEPECGITKHRQFSKRIIGGEKAQFAELPWQVGHHFINFKYLESCLMLSLMVLLLTMLSVIVLSVIVL